MADSSVVSALQWREGRYWWKCREDFAGRKCVWEVGRFSLVQQQSPAGQGKEWCFGKPVTSDKTEWKYLCGMFFSQIQIFKWLSQWTNSEMNMKLAGQAEVRPGSPAVCQGLPFSPLISWHFKTDWSPPLTPHILTCTESVKNYFPISVCYDLKTVRLEVDLWLPQ